MRWIESIHSVSQPLINGTDQKQSRADNFKFIVTRENCIRQKKNK